ncbi:Uncharacterised protein [Vibrio cholerae]|nr:Uncharacterised protein [Vibrio cholerae]
MPNFDISSRSSNASFASTEACFRLAPLKPNPEIKWLIHSATASASSNKASSPSPSGRSNESSKSVSTNCALIASRICSALANAPIGQPMPSLV